MFPIRGTFLGVPIVGFIAFWGLYWCLLIFGNYQTSKLFMENFLPEVLFTKLPCESSTGGPGVVGVGFRLKA